MRKLVVFGNGLGRALSNDAYSLERALEDAWLRPRVLDDSQRQLIRQCLPADVLELNDRYAPKSESELDTLQRVLAACDEISKLEIEGGQRWLNDHGKSFPSAIRSYVHAAASYFHQLPYFLPDSFTKPLLEWIQDSRSHVATLNYDDLLYRAFINTPVFQGYNCLLDGFVPAFSPDNLERRNPNRQAYYLHLHGTPLYYTAVNGSIRKLSLGALSHYTGISTTHLVLTHAVHKQGVISASEVLIEYWRRLDLALSEVEGVILFGYGGGDAHLNSMIARHFSGRDIEVVVRRSAEFDTSEGREQFFAAWGKRIPGAKILAHWHCESILDFTNWGYRRT